LDKQFRCQNLKFLYEKKLGYGYKNDKIRLEYTDINSLKVIWKWDKNKTEKYPKDTLRSIDYEQSELDKSTGYTMKISQKKQWVTPVIIHCGIVTEMIIRTIFKLLKRNRSIDLSFFKATICKPIYNIFME